MPKIAFLPIEHELLPACVEIDYIVLATEVGQQLSI
jgi:hypothetical protein